MIKRERRGVKRRRLHDFGMSGGQCISGPLK